MKRNKKQFGWLGLSVVATVIGMLAANAVNAATAYYQLGEADTSAALNAPPHDGDGGGTVTVDSSGNGFDLTRTGTPTYSASLVAPGTGSTLSVQFSSADPDWYSRGAAVTAATTDVFMEAWAYPTVGSEVAYVAYNGNAAANGYGFLQDGTTWSFIEGGTGHFNFATGPLATVVTGQWVHLSLLLDSSGTLTGYINGTLVVTQSLGANTPSGGFFIGGGIGGGNFDGNVDQVLVDLPEPASASVLLVSGLALMGLRRRQ